MEIKPFDRLPRQPNYSFMFVIEDEIVVDTISDFNFDEAFYKDSYEKIITHLNKKDIFKLDSRRWTFLQMPNDNFIVMDVTTQYEMLNNMLYTFLSVAFFTLLAIIGISVYFSSKAILPIKTAFNLQKRFIADASHELNTPLTIIRTNLDYIYSNNNMTIEEQKKWFDVVDLQIHRMKSLINELLHLVKLDNVKNNELSQINASEISNDIVISLEAMMFERNIEFSYDIEEDNKILWNEEYFRQTIGILLDNSAKYSIDPSKIWYTLYKHNNHVIIDIENTSENYTQDQLDKLWERFYRIDQSRRDIGFGLGLSIAKSLVEDAGGKITSNMKDTGIIRFRIILNKV
jgi:signal transduction histidine kinase